MTDNTESLLFWLEQEPVDSTEDIYLPPDTPITRPSHKIQSQIHKIQEIKKQRAVERLKAVHFENLSNFRSNFASLVARDQLPNQHKECLEYVDSDIYLKDNLSDILKLVQDIDKIKEDESIVKTIQVKDTGTSEEMKQELNLKEQVRVKYGQALEEQFNHQQHQTTSQYNKLLYSLKPSIAHPVTPTPSEAEYSSPSSSPPYLTRTE